jgi:anaerobic selenocysteine-containing dehydrogenase
MKILLGDFNFKVGKEDIFKPIKWDETLQEIANANGARVVNLPHPKTLLSKVRRSHIVPLINSLGRLLMESLAIKLTIF